MKLARTILREVSSAKAKRVSASDIIGRALMADRASCQSRIEGLERAMKEAQAANERDRTEVCLVVNSLTDAFSRRDWLLRGGRGSYEWDDDRFRDEFRDAMLEFAPHVDRLRKIGADRQHCPETQAEIAAARSTLEGK